MSGVKGRSGGPRKNSGGARPGAGRKPKNQPPKKSPNAEQPAPEPVSSRDPLEYLLSVVADKGEDPKLRVRAAIGAAQYLHPKKEGGKKDDRKQKATEVANKFTSAPPPLKLVK